MAMTKPLKRIIPKIRLNRHHYSRHFSAFFCNGSQSLLVIWGYWNHAFVFWSFFYFKAIPFSLLAVVCPYQA